MGPKRKGRGRTVKGESNSQKRNETARQIMEQLNSRDEVKDEATPMAAIIREEADELRDNMNEDVQRIRDNLRVDYLIGLKQRINQIKTDIKNIKVPKSSSIIIWVPILIGILTYLICCFSLCEENDCCGPILLTFPLLMSKKALCWCLLQTINLLEKIPCEDDNKLISTPPPPVLKEKLTELATLFQEEDTQDDLMMFWIPLVLGVFFGILLIGGLIVALLKWINRARNNQSLLGINHEGNWVYGSKLQDKAALTAEKGKNLAPVTK